MWVHVYANGWATGVGWHKDVHFHMRTNVSLRQGWGGVLMFMITCAGTCHVHMRDYLLYNISLLAFFCMLLLVPWRCFGRKASRTVRGAKLQERGWDRYPGEFSLTTEARFFRLFLDDPEVLVNLSIHMIRHTL